MNAVTLELLVGMYYRETPDSWKDSVAQRDGLSYLLKHDLISPNSEILGVREPSMALLTPKGRAHVQALVNAPFPVQSWTSPLPTKE
jgi:hypothetical protein